MIQMMIPINGMNVQKPVTPLTGFGCPARAYMFPTSDGIRNELTIPMRIPMTSPIGPPTPSWVWSFISRNTW